MKVVVHHRKKATVEIAVGVEETSWSHLARHFVEKSLLHPPQLFQLLSSLSPSHHTGYLLRYGDGYATIVDAIWATGNGNIGSGEDGVRRPIEANITLKPRGGDEDAGAAAWRRWTTAMSQRIDMANNDDGIIHVDLVVEKVGLADDHKKNGRGGKISVDDGFRYTMTKFPYPIDDAKTNVLHVKEHSQFARVIDKFHVERLIANTAADINVEEGGVFPLAPSANDVAAKAEDDFTRKTKASATVVSTKALVAAAASEKGDGADLSEEREVTDNSKERPKRPLNAYIVFTNEARKQIQEDNPDCKAKEIMSKLGEAWTALDDNEKTRFRVIADEAKAKFLEEYGEDAFLKTNKKTKKTKKTKNLATNNDIGSADSNGSEVKMQNLDGSRGHPATGENASSDVVAQPAKGLPDGWTTRTVPRKNDDSKSDPYWFSPKNFYKFNSIPQVNRFCAYLEQVGGDEAAAFVLYSKDKKKKPDDLPAAGKGESSAKDYYFGAKRTSDAVAVTGGESSAKKSRKKYGETAAAEEAKASAVEHDVNDTHEKKKASNAVIAANANAHAANILVRAKALAATTASEKASKAFIVNPSQTKSATLENPEETTTSATKKSPSPKDKADATAVIERTNERMSPKKLKRAEYVVATQAEEKEGVDVPSPLRKKELINADGDNMTVVDADAVEEIEAGAATTTKKRKKKGKKSSKKLKGYLSE